jgi:hypothetical protein
VFHRRLGTDLAAGPGNVSRLRYTFKLISQRQVAVKLHGVFAFSWKLTDSAPLCRFHRPRRGDSRALVGPSCKSPIKRQGITLTSVAFKTSVRRRTMISHDLRMSPCGSDCIFAHLRASGAQSLRILEISSRAFPADYLHQRIFTHRVALDTQASQHMAGFY